MRSQALDERGADDGFLAAYVRSMPATYLAAFDDATIEAHAGIVERRGAMASHVEIWKELFEGVVAICVVADDRMGLLSRVCAALVAHDVDVIAAQAYGRVRPDGVAEAVDFLWIQRSPTAPVSVGPLRVADVARIAETLDAIVRGRASFQGLVSFARAVRSAGHATRVTFAWDDAPRARVMAVEAVDHPGLLLAVTSALALEGAQIVASHATTEGQRVRDWFVLVERGGEALSEERELAIQTAVLRAIDAARTD